MEKEVMKKMARYVELSEKFTKAQSDIFTSEEMSNCYVNDPSFGGTFTINNGSIGSSALHFDGTVYIGGREIYIDEKGNVKAKDGKDTLTRGQQLEAATMLKVKARAILLDEYDEYVKLRKSLNNYFSGINKLINE